MVSSIFWSSCQLTYPATCTNANLVSWSRDFSRSSILSKILNTFSVGRNWHFRHLCPSTIKSSKEHFSTNNNFVLLRFSRGFAVPWWNMSPCFNQSSSLFRMMFSRWWTKDSVILVILIAPSDATLTTGLLSILLDLMINSVSSLTWKISVNNNNQMINNFNSLRTMYWFQIQNQIWGLQFSH